MLGPKPKTKDRLEQSHFDDEITDPLPDEIPIRFALSAGDVTNDAHHAAISEIEGDRELQVQRGSFQLEHEASRFQVIANELET